MKAMLLKEYGKLEITEMATPDIGPSDVLVQVKMCGICGSDIHGYDGSSGRRVPPVVMGHEASGVVAEVGAAVTKTRKGDRVTFDSTIYCGHCFYCRRGRMNLCANREVFGVSCPDFRRNGAFADYVVVPERIIYPLPDSLSFEHAIFVEALSVALHAVDRTPILLGETVVVVGVGMIGLLVVQVLRSVGCGRIVGVDVDDAKLALAQKLGATDGFNPERCDVPAELANLTEGRGADAAFEVVGAPASVNTAIASVRKGAVVTLIGNLSPRVEFPLQSIVSRELVISGTVASTNEYPAAIQMLGSGSIQLAPLITAVAPLSEGPAWFDRLHRRERNLVKVILHP